jgi:hypothetical protein
MNKLISRSALFCAIALMGCSAADRQERSWTEDVLLEDGTIVQIERHVIFDETNALGGGAANAVESKSTLKFTGQLAALPAWDFPRIALVLYRSKESGNWRIVSTTSSCAVWRRDGAPRPPYWEHELSQEGWQLVSLHPESIGKAANLFYRYISHEFGRHIDQQSKQRLQSSPTIAEKYRSIAANPQGFNCRDAPAGV